MLGLFPGEKEAIKTVIALGEKYGYGNLISHLKRAWALHLAQDYGLDYEAALHSTEVSAYPKDFDIDKLP